MHELDLQKKDQMVSVSLERTEGDYGFLVQDAKEHSFHIDSSREHGGLENGFRPMQALLAALGGCSAIDIVSMLKKQRQQVDGFSILVEGEREEGVMPALWKRVHVAFTLSGPIEEERAQKACALSIEKYCSVAETLRRAGASVSWSLSVHHPISTK